MTLFAQWELIAHTVTVIGGTADHAIAPQNTTVTLTANATQAGYRFANWTSTSTGVTITNPAQADGSTFVMPDNAVVITANFEPTTHAVTFNLNSGTRTGGGALSQTITAGQGATLPTFTRAGYDFTGWTSSVANMTPCKYYRQCYFYG